MKPPSELELLPLHFEKQEDPHYFRDVAARMKSRHLAEVSEAILRSREAIVLLALLIASGNVALAI